MTKLKEQRRSPHAQLEGMRRDWPDLKSGKLPCGTLCWRGPLRPRARVYEVLILWKPGAMMLPYVTVLQPTTQPRDGDSFEEIPHLIFNKEDPEKSGLCLFDPEEREWTGLDLISDTTVDWTSEWLLYYELWHLFGEWLGPSVGYESVAQMNAAQSRAVKEALSNVH